MFSRKGKHEPPRRAIVEPPSAESLGISGLAGEADDDGGISLEELGETYAALLAKGADPYQEGQDSASSDAQREVAEALRSSEVATASREQAVRRIVEGDDDEGCEITPRSILEAILFVGHPLNEPLTSRQIAGLMRGVAAGEIDELIGELNEAYAASGAPYLIRSSGAGYLLELCQEFAPLRDKFYGRIKEARLTQSAIEVLAIVAYNQPISLPELDRIRGRPSGGVVSQLVRRDLLAYQRGEEKSKPTYRTTDRFLDLYGLESLEDLPQVDRNLS